jgi:outer membrane protein TolC
MRRIIFLVILSWGWMCAAAQDTLVIGSLGDALAGALAHNPTQLVYRQQVTQARLQYKATQGAFYPNASGAFTGTDNLHLATTPIPGELVGAPGTTYYAQFGKKYTYNTGITLTQNIVNWQAMLATKLADNNLALTQSQQAYYEQSLREQVARTYFSVLIARTSLRIIGDDEKIGDSLVLLAGQRLSEGTGDAISVNQATINRNNVQQNKALSRQLYDQGVENLKILLGAKVGTEVLLSGEIRADSVIEAVVVAPGVDRNLDIYRQQINIAVLQRKSQRSAALPLLSATGYIGVQQFRNDFGMSFEDGAWSGYRYIGLNLSVPIFTGLSNTYKYRSAEVQQTIVGMQYQAAADQSAINDRLLLKNHADYLELAKVSAQSFQLYAKNLRLNGQKFEEGVLTMDVYLKAFQDYLTAENTYLNNLSQLLSIKATLLSRP